MEEIVALARKRNIALSGEVPDRALEMIDALPADATPSMQRDVIAGEPPELSIRPAPLCATARRPGRRLP